MVAPFNWENVETLAKDLKRCYILSEHIIHGGKTLYKSLSDLFDCVLDQEVIPEDWRESLIVPIYKGKGKDKNNPSR